MVSKAVANALECSNHRFCALIRKPYCLQLPRLPFKQCQQNIVFAGLAANHQIGLPVAKFLSRIYLGRPFLNAAAKHFLMLTASGFLCFTAELLGEINIFYANQA